MRKFGITFVVALLAIAFTSVAYGQGKAITTGGSANSALGIAISGSYDLDYVYRDGAMNELLTGAAWGTAGARSSNFYNGQATIHFDISLADNVTAVLEVENKRTVALATDAAGLFYEQAYVNFAEIFNPNLAMRVGVQDVRSDIRGNGNSFFLDTTESESAFADLGSVTPMTSKGATTESTGFLFTYDDKNASWALDIGLFTVVEAGSTAADEDLYFLQLTYDLPESMGQGSSLVPIIAILNGGPDVEVYTFGVEVSLKELAAASTEIFAGAFFQTGDAGTKLNARGSAFYIGGRYNFQSSNDPWIEASFTMISGDNDTTDKDDDRFFSYEDNDQFAILEENYFGLDLDSNYNAFKISGGVTVAVGSDTLDIVADLGFFTLQEKIAVTGGTDDDLGTEFDLSGVYNFNQNVTFDATLAFLFGADVLKAYTTDAESSTNLFTLGTTVSF